VALLERNIACLVPQEDKNGPAPTTARTAQAYDFSANLSARCFLRDTVLVDRVDGAPGFHAIEFRVDSPYLFYQPVNDRARGEVAAFIALAASVFEIDRREKSTSDTVTANFADLDQRVQALSDQIRILHNQYARQLAVDERRLQALTSQIEALSNQYDARLKKLEDDLRVRR
jgi:hypothetical protein